MPRNRRVIGLTVAFISLAVPLFADPITVVSVTQNVFVTASVGNVFQLDADTAGTLLSAEVTVSSGGGTANAGASLDSSVLPTRFGAIGSTSTGVASPTETAGGIAQAGFGVTFDVHETQRFVFGGSLFDTEGPFNWSSAVAHLTGFDGSEAFLFSGSGQQDVFAQGLLTPGRYFFSVVSATQTFPQLGTAQVRGGFNVGLAFVPAADPVPEPGSLLLLGTGALGLLAHRRRRASL